VSQCFFALSDTLKQSGTGTTVREGGQAGLLAKFAEFANPLAVLAVLVEPLGEIVGVNAHVIA